MDDVHQHNNCRSTIMTKRVCLFGLSGDPPTGEGGHVGIVRSLIQLQLYDEIRVVPVYRHTFDEKRSRLVSFEHRMNMCKEAFAGIEKVSVSDAEYQSWRRSIDGIPEEDHRNISVGTASLLDYLHEIEPTYEFHFCLGADAFLDLTAGKWKESSRVLELLAGRLLVLHRKSEDDSTTTTMTTTTSELQTRIEQNPGSRLLHVDGLNAVSSSKARVTNNIDELSTMLVPGVLRYIQDHKLYAFSR